MKDMKSRTFNILTALTLLAISLLGLIGIHYENVSRFTEYAVLAAIAVSAIMLVRTCLSTIMLKREEKLDVTSTEEDLEDLNELTEIAISLRRDPEVVTKYLEWIKDKKSRRFSNVPDAIIAKITDCHDENGTVTGYWICLVGTRRAYHQFKEEVTNATVLDNWPFPYGPGEDASLLDEFDEEADEDDDAESLPEDLPGDGN